MKQKLYNDKSKVERAFMVNEPIWACIPDRGFHHSLGSGVQVLFWRCVEWYLGGISSRWAL